MRLDRIYDEDLAQASYLIGCQASGEAVVVDPRRDITEYLDLADRHGLQIVAVTETHIHADYLSGTRELAAATGARIYLSGEGGQDWQYGFEGTRLYDRDSFAIGNITIEARHTPGHTPEHLSFLVTDGAFSSDPGYLLSGDFIFVGDLGRPDLLDEAAGGVDTRFAGAQDLFASLKNLLLDLPDHVQIYPAHGAGSACGKALGAVPATTVGYERLFAWWASYLRNDDEQGFVSELLADQPDAHAYFARMKRQNKEGPQVLGPLAPLAEWDTGRLAAALQEEQVTFADTRPREDVHRGTVAGALHIPGPDKAATYGAWVFDPERETAPLVLLAPDSEVAEDIRAHLVRVGIDDVAGYTTELAGLPTAVPAVVSPDDLEDLTDGDNVHLLDVRNRTEHAEGAIPGSDQLAVGRLMWHLDDLPAAGTLVAYCQSGNRSSVAGAALRRAGHDVVEVTGGFQAWSQTTDTLDTPVRAR
ncbi:MBL fold metallo-hydrolase [Pseudactinotalea sp. Z1739]|uniref:MBL fold metallo-hydrolase n=1 Tax=Pseudactinotalea sp. Z1739 TaxID=3413028 RepID=UPI003C7EAB05